MRYKNREAKLQIKVMDFRALLARKLVVGGKCVQLLPPPSQREIFADSLGLEPSPSASMHSGPSRGGSQGSYHGARVLWGPARHKVCIVLKVHRRAWPKDRGPLRERTLGPGPALDGPACTTITHHYSPLVPPLLDSFITSSRNLCLLGLILKTNMALS